MPNLPIQAYDYPLPEDKIALFPTKIGMNLNYWSTKILKFSIILS